MIHGEETDEQPTLERTPCIVRAPQPESDCSPAPEVGTLPGRRPARQCIHALRPDTPRERPPVAREDQIPRAPCPCPDRRREAFDPTCCRQRSTRPLSR